jgi:HEPN domain-containing protein
MSDAERVASFLTLAREDLEAARLLKVSVSRQAAFFLQQAVEKIGKALLIREGIDPARVHAIGKLAAELPESHPLRAKLMVLDRLSVYATATRYPSPTQSCRVHRTQPSSRQRSTPCPTCSSRPYPSSRHHDDEATSGRSQARRLCRRRRSGRVFFVKRSTARDTRSRESGCRRVGLGAADDPPCLVCDSAARSAREAR